LGRPYRQFGKLRKIQPSLRKIQPLFRKKQPSSNFLKSNPLFFFIGKSNPSQEKYLPYLKLNYLSQLTLLKSTQNKSFRVEEFSKTSEKTFDGQDQKVSKF